MGHPKTPTRPPMANYGGPRPAIPPTPIDNQVPKMPPQYGGGQPGLVQGMERLSVTQQGFNKLWVS